MIRKIEQSDYPRLAEIWESAVLHTHDFLKKEDFLYYKEHVPSYFPHVTLWGFEQEGCLVGFIGIAEDNIEMLFVDNNHRRKGIGKQLSLYVINELHVTKVDVNEQNAQAVGFYTHLGFRVAGKSKTDNEGKPYPILHLHLQPTVPMNTPTLETDHLVLRKFTEKDIEALFLILKDEETNRFLPWFPVKNIRETEAFYQERYATKYKQPQAYAYAICLKSDNFPIGYIKVDMEEHHDFGYGLRREFWHKGIATEAGRIVIEQVRKDGLPYITATHDRNNPRSGNVMRKLGMTYCYSYEEQWQPKNFPVIFRMYQLNLDGNTDSVYRKYWDTSDNHFIEDL